MTWEIQCGDSRALLATVPDACVDAVVCDPPYDLTAVSRGGSARTNDSATPYGRHNLQGKGFMGLQWDGTGIAFDPTFWAEVLRVLKPGGHLLAFGGTRTYHRMGCAVEDAGFEIRDSILQPSWIEDPVGLVAWMHGQGFPKSLDVAKAMSKKNGVKPLAVEPATLGMANNPQWNELNNRLVMPEPEGLAAEWEGFGTALKPAWEPVIVARKPLVGTVVENVLAHGTGALNIDGCRVGGPAYTQEEWNAKGAADLGESDHLGQKTKKGAQAYADGKIPVPDGRWPANVVLSHHESCIQVGQAKTKAITGTAAGRMAGNVVGTAYGDYAGSERAGEKTGFGDADGNESVAVYACVPGCPVRELDGQTGESRSRKGIPRSSKEPGVGWDMTATGAEYDDSGGASRFYYQAKPSRREKDLGCAEAGVPPKYRKGDAEKKDPYYNDHPTSKSVSLMRWLVRLVGGKPGSLILDPFAGGGTTGVACVLEGFSFAGIDREQPYVDIARARIVHAEKHPEEFVK